MKAAVHLRAEGYVGYVCSEEGGGFDCGAGVIAGRDEGDENGNAVHLRTGRICEAVGDMGLEVGIYRRV